MPKTGFDGTTNSGSALIINGLSLLPVGELCAPATVDGINIIFRSINDLAFAIEPDRVRVYETISERDLADFGLVHVVEYPRPTAVLLSAIADYLRIHKVPAVNIAGIGPPTKLFQYVRLAQAGLPIPKTVYRSPRLLADSYAELVDEFGLPFVLKAMHTSGGRFNYLISCEGDLIRYLQEPAKAYRFLAQKFIPNDATIRILVFDEEATFAIRRTGVDELYLTNTAQGGRAVLLATKELDPVAARLAVQAASLVGYEVAGVNLIQDWTTGQWYVLDVNSSPAIATGAFVQQKLEAYSSYLKHKLAVSSSADAILRRN